MPHEPTYAKANFMKSLTPALVESNAAPHAVSTQNAANHVIDDLIVDFEYIEEEEESDAYIDAYHQNAECESRTP